MQLLLDEGADTTISGDFGSPVDVAREEKHLELAVLIAGNFIDCLF